MAFYDNYYLTRQESLTPIGKRIVDHWNQFFIHLIIKSINKAPKNISVLEIGPGKGYFARLLTKQGFQYSGIEANLTMAKSLQKSGFKVVPGLVPPIKLKKKFDVIFLDQVFEHMLNWQVATELLKQIQLHLNPGGIVIISCPDVAYWGSDFFVGDYTHTLPTSLRNLEQILLDNNFSILESGNYSLFTQNQFLCQIISMITKFTYSLGLFHLVFKSKAFKVKSSLLPACFTVARLAPPPPIIKHKN